VRLVLDTNLIVSALLKPASVPSRALGAVWSAGNRVLYDARIASEYRDVLSRPKFRAIARADIDAFFATLSAQGEDLGTVDAWAGAMPDDDDRIFVEVALAGRADAIVTGNLRHFPMGLGFEVHPPATLLAMLGCP
jgi:uncharacterized protein